MLKQAENITNALIDLNKDSEEKYTKKLKGFYAQIYTIKSKYDNVLSNF